MTSAYVLIAAVLLLGGILAVLGDRIGTKVGKARLRLFNLRPRNTATLITVLTGLSISGSSLIILFSLSKSLREGVFNLDTILANLRIAQAQLNEVSAERTRIDGELGEAILEKERTERSFRLVQERYREMTAQARRLQTELEVLRSQRERLLVQIPRLQQQVRERDDLIAGQDQILRDRNSRIVSQDQILRQRAVQLNRLQTQRGRLQSEISQRDTRIQALDDDIAQRDETLQAREINLQELTAQLNFVRQEVAILEQYYQDYQALRQGNLALVRGEVLSFGVLRVVDTTGALTAVDQLLSQANRRAIEATRPFGNQNGGDRVVQITQAQVNQLVEQIGDGQDYVVRILSAGNYVEQEQAVLVFADAVPNQKLFNAGEVIATVSVDSNQMTEQEVRARLDTLLAAAQFRARRAGVLGEIQVGDGTVQTFTRFLDQLQTTPERFGQIQAVVEDNTFTAGPLRINLRVYHNGQVIFQSSTRP